MTLTYRGCSYNKDQQVQQDKAWWNLAHRPWLCLKYRNACYFPFVTGGQIQWTRHSLFTWWTKRKRWHAQMLSPSVPWKNWRKNQYLLFNSSIKPLINKGFFIECCFTNQREFFSEYFLCFTCKLSMLHLRTIGATQINVMYPRSECSIHKQTCLSW